VYAIKWEEIPAKLVIDVDQMGVYVLPNNSRTFHDKGAAQVDAVAKDEKQAYTLLVASTATVDFLPFQQVWGGKTSRFLPSATAPGMKDALEQCFHFTNAASEKNPNSHFSTLKMMKEWVVEIMVPYVQGVIEANPDLDEHQKAILFIDIYPVHAGQDFTGYIFNDHPNIILIFVPGNCTGIFQPADVGLQRVIKHFLKQQLFAYLAETHRGQISSGISPEDVKITTSFPKLRDASVAGLVQAYDFMSGFRGRELILKVS